MHASLPIALVLAGIGAVWANVPGAVEMTNDGSTPTKTVSVIQPTGSNSASHADDLPEAAIGYPCVPHGTLYPSDITSHCVSGTECVLLISAGIAHSNPHDTLGDFYACVKTVGKGEKCTSVDVTKLSNPPIDPNITMCSGNLGCTDGVCSGQLPSFFPGVLAMTSSRSSQNYVGSSGASAVKAGGVVVFAASVIAAASAILY